MKSLRNYLQQPWPTGWIRVGVVFWREHPFLRFAWSIAMRGAASLALAGVAQCQTEQPKVPIPVPVAPTDFSVPFDDWVAAGKRTDIPWRFSLAQTHLSFDQRLEFAVNAEVTSKELARLGDKHELFLLTRVGDEQGQWLEQGWLAIKVSRPLPKNAAITFRMPFFVTPGKYSVAVALYDRTTQRYSFRSKKIEAKPLKNDPLPTAFASLPRVQVLRPSGKDESQFISGIQSKLSLPVQTCRPIHFEIVLILGHEEQQSIRFAAPFSSFGFSLTALNVLTQLQPRTPYSFHVTVVDPFRRQILVEQKNAKEVDWASLRAKVREFNPGVISAQALETSYQNPAFLRDIFTGRLLEPLAEVGGKRPLRVFLLLGTPMLFPIGVNRQPISPEALVDALFFHIRRVDLLPFFAGRRRLPALPSVRQSKVFENYYVSNDVKKILKTTDAKFYEVLTPEQFREALAQVIAGIEKQGQATTASARLPL